MKTKNLLLIIALVGSLSLITSCQSEENPIPDKFEINPEVDGGYVLTSTSARLPVVINSNHRWSVEVDAGWCSVYPKIGKDDGRFYISADNLNLAYPRICNLVVRNENGEEIFKTVLTQKGIPPVLEAVGSNSLSSSSIGGQFVISLISNVVWEAKLLEPVDWITLGESTESSQSITINENSGDEKRYATIRFSGVGIEDVSMDVTIVQLPKFSINNATHITISEAIATCSGLIENNVKIVGYVTNDASTKNLPENYMYLQDDSGKGLLVEFANLSDNTYALNDKLTIWLTGCQMKTYAQGYKSLASVGSSNILKMSKTSESEAATPVEIYDLSTVGQYNNTLVKLKDVYFAVPLGTLYNSSGVRTGTYPCSDYYRTTIMDSHGNTAVINTLYTFTERWKGGISAKKYDITGIMYPETGEMEHEKFTNTLHVRNYNDLKAYSTASAFVPIVQWYTSSAVNLSTSWVPATGTGTFNFDPDKAPRNSKAAYADVTLRYSYALINPSSGYSDANSWQGYSQYGWWDSSTGGQYWEFSTSTRNASGDIYLTLMLGSFGSGPAFWDIYWSADGTVWNYSGGYELWNGYSNSGSATIFSHLYTTQEFAYKLQGAQGKDNIKVRLKVRNEQSVKTSRAAISTSSPSMVFYIGILEKSN